MNHYYFIYPIYFATDHRSRWFFCEFVGLVGSVPNACGSRRSRPSGREARNHRISRHLGHFGPRPDRSDSSLARWPSERLLASTATHAERIHNPNRLRPVRHTCYHPRLTCFRRNMFLTRFACFCKNYFCFAWLSDHAEEVLVNFNPHSNWKKTKNSVASTY